MSDFDKEAERERLREQYEQEQRKREATEHMSELLLKGATMTDAHCKECGDPIFRYDGQEFCPTCQQPVDADQAGAQEAGEGQAQPDDADAAQADAATESDDSATADRPDHSPSASAERQVTDRSGGRGDVDDPSAPAARTQAAGAAGGADPGNVAEARASLRQALVTFSRQAAATDDPRRAREALETAREAADALDALEDLR